MKVFHGISGAAGQPASSVRGLRSIGVDAQSFVLGSNKFEFHVDHRIEPAEDLNDHLFGMLQHELLDFDVFHFYFRSLFYSPKDGAYPHGLDLILLKLFNKKVVMNFRGSEVRLHSQFESHSPFNYVAEDPDELTTKFPEEMQRSQIDLCRSVCDHILVPDPELQGYVPGSLVVPRGIDVDGWQPCPKERVRPLVVHAPSRRIVKGTQSVVDAVAVLREEGLEFDFVLIEDKTHDEARRLYEEADVIVDQLRIGWYGVLAVEGMALQKAVISYIRDDLLEHLGDRPPLVIANPNTVASKLRELITNTALRTEIARRGRLYCETVHDEQAIALQLKEIYESPNKDVDAEFVTRFLRSQHYALKTLREADANTIRQLERDQRILTANLNKTKTHLETLQHKLRHFYKIRGLYRRLVHSDS